MKRPDGIEDLTSQLTAAATAPLIQPAATASSPEASKRRPGGIAVYLRLPPDMHAKYANEATIITKATGKGVTVQQVILDKLRRAG